MDNKIISKAFLLLGSNLGDRISNLQKAIIKIEEVCGKIVQTSFVYETTPWGFLNQAPFLNQVVVLETIHTPNLLIHCLLDIEIEIGRIREFKLGPRIIDIDILLFDNEIINNSILTVPHPELPNRRFALIPLAEVGEDLIHPLLNKTIKQILSECIDEGHVQKFSE